MTIKDTYRASLVRPDELLGLLSYDEESGDLTWRERRRDMFGSSNHWAAWNSRFAGKPALACHDPSGYLHGRIFYKRYFAHRVIWAMNFMEWPKWDIDHINGIRDDNRIGNLRSVTRSDNMKNKRMLDSNTSGVTGVSWDAVNGKWRASIGVDGRSVNIGRFASLGEAVKAREDAEAKYGYHDGHGKR